MSPVTGWKIIGFTEMNSGRNVSIGFSGLFALLLYLLFDEYNQYLTNVDKISFLISGICLLALLMHQLRNVWLTLEKRRSDEHLLWWRPRNWLASLSRLSALRLNSGLKRNHILVLPMTYLLIRKIGHFRWPTKSGQGLFFAVEIISSWVRFGSLMAAGRNYLGDRNVP